MLHEARIILPGAAAETVVDRDVSVGRDVLLDERLEQALVHTFGGFTRTEGYGGWKAPDGRVIGEYVQIYDVACRLEDTQTLETICGYLALLGRQECVYLRQPNGSVSFVKPWHSSLAGPVVQAKLGGAVARR